MLVLPDPDVARGNAPPRFNRGRLHKDQPRTAYGAATQVHQMPIVCEAIVTGVLAHRRDGGAIAEGDIAILNGRKQVCMHR